MNRIEDALKTVFCKGIDVQKSGGFPIYETPGEGKVYGYPLVQVDGKSHYAIIGFQGRFADELKLLHIISEHPRDVYPYKLYLARPLNEAR